MISSYSFYAGSFSCHLAQKVVQKVELQKVELQKVVQKDALSFPTVVQGYVLLTILAVDQAFLTILTLD